MSWNRTAAFCIALTGLVLAGCNETTSEIAAPDTAPPLPPQEVKAYLKNGVTCVSWSPNGETDLAGYNVYQMAPPSRLNGNLLTDVAFSTAAQFSQNSTIRVTAVDVNGNESAPSRFARVSTADEPTGGPADPSGPEDVLN
jgi:hypothetical protein